VISFPRSRIDPASGESPMIDRRVVVLPTPFLPAGRHFPFPTDRWTPWRMWLVRRTCRRFRLRGSRPHSSRYRRGRTRRPQVHLAHVPSARTRSGVPSQRISPGGGHDPLGEGEDDVHVVLHHHEGGPPLPRELADVFEEADPLHRVHPAVGSSRKSSVGRRRAPRRLQEAQVPWRARWRRVPFRKKGDLREHLLRLPQGRRLPREAADRPPRPAVRAKTGIITFCATVSSGNT